MTFTTIDAVTFRGDATVTSAPRIADSRSSSSGKFEKRNEGGGCDASPTGRSTMTSDTTTDTLSPLARRTRSEASASHVGRRVSVVNRCECTAYERSNGWGCCCARPATVVFDDFGSLILAEATEENDR